MRYVEIIEGETMLSDIPNIVMQELYKTGMTPEECDDGYCGFVADKIIKRLGHGEVMDASDYPFTYFAKDNPMHTWVKVNGLHYDVETPFGVKDPRQLGYFRRMRGDSPPPTNYEPDDPAMS